MTTVVTGGAGFLGRRVIARLLDSGEDVVSLDVAPRSGVLGGLTEFNTAVRHGVDLITVVCNDGAYGAERDNLQGRGHGVGLSLIPWPDLAPVADALGGSGFTVRTAADLQHMAKVIAERHAPLLIDVKLDPAATVA
jgi:acetolactate synthase-1/2/3 large subunit